MFLDDDGTSTNTSDPWGSLSESGNSDPWGSLSGSGNSDPSWDSEVTGGDNTSTDVGTDTGSGSYTGGGNNESVFNPGSISSGYEYGFTKNEDGSSQRYNVDGSVTYQDPDGQVYTVNQNGTYTTDFGGSKYTYDPAQSGFVDAAGKLIVGGVNSSVTGKSLMDRIKNEIKANPLASALTGAAALKTLYDQFNKQGGYNKPVPKMDMVREQIQYNDPNRRPGESGRQYFTDPRFATQGDTEALTAAKAASTGQGQGILAAYQPRPAQAPNPYAGKMNLAFSRQGGDAPNIAQSNEIETDQQAQGQRVVGGLKSAYSISPVTRSALPAESVRMPSSSVGGGNFEFNKRVSTGMPLGQPTTPPTGMIENPEYIARGATGPDQPMDMRHVPRYISGTPSESLDLSKIPTGLAVGGLANAGRYLQGKTDGMADEIKTSIDGEQPALLSHGEFVIPADVVSHLGNGNSEAGAEKLYAMMDKIREARTGTKEQGKEINADKFLAAASGGLMAAYAGGGSVQKFNTGGTPVATTPTTTAGGGVPLDTSRTSTLSPWVGDYVTNALGQGAALANAPYQAYQGPLTAGASDLQNQAFAGASEMAQAGYTPGQFTGSFTPQMAAQYMNPYLQASLDPQLKELNRQSEIARIQDAGRLTKAGAFGGSRQAIMESEGRRNLLDKQQETLGTGYKTAYDLAMQQFAKDRGEEEASRQFGANFGMKSVNQLADLGATQRGITSEGIAADKAAFEEQRDFAYKMPQYQLNLLQGLPIGANTTSSDQTGLAKIQSDIAGLGGLYKTIKGSLDALGQTPTTTG